MTNKEYIERIIPAMKKNFELDNPSTSFDEIHAFTEYWSVTTYNNPSLLRGLFHGMFYLN